jgi:hypothetical protein
VGSRGGGGEGGGRGGGGGDEADVSSDFTENRFRNFAANRSSQAISQSDHGIWLLEVIAVRRLAMACLPCMRVEHQERGFQAVHDLTS